MRIHVQVQMPVHRISFGVQLLPTYIIRYTYIHNHTCDVAYVFFHARPRSFISRGPQASAAMEPKVFGPPAPKTDLQCSPSWFDWSHTPVQSKEARLWSETHVNKNLAQRKKWYESGDFARLAKDTVILALYRPELMARIAKVQRK